jgi:hypothetical protein
VIAILAVTEHRTLDEPTAKQAWEVYEQTFTAINEFAAQRHLMFRHEFDEVVADQRVRKYLAWDDYDRMVGLSTITNDLEAWPLISPPYFRRNWPDHYARRAIWYIGIVGVHPDAVGAHVFSRLIDAMSPLVFSTDGLAVMDFCEENEVKRMMPRVTNLLLQRLHPDGANVRHRRVDAQATHVFRFDGQEV